MFTQIIRYDAMKIKNETFWKYQLDNWHKNAIKDISKLVIKIQLYCSNMINIKSQFKFGNLQVLNTKTIID